jgi:peptidoglycan/LPS O-acetylase OafA/YrhL
LEIDGLRAFAVMAVLLYHFSVPGFGGGFVGVDVFFAISGFLIGEILWRELTTTGTLSLMNFYARRIRRLAPAFCVMAVVTFIVAYIVLLPFEFRDFGKALIASTVYLSNVYFYRQAGYFDNAAEDKILLHTWSLSVEEQFYIFLPVFMILLCRNRTALISILIAIFVISLGLCIAITPVSHTATFFLFPFRAWELLGGVLLAIYGYQRGDNWQHSAWLSWLGIAMLAAAVVFVEPGPSFPGIQAVLPVLGTLLILYNGRQVNYVNRALSTPLVVFIGLISYSLYLWHWPVVTLSRYYRDGAGGTVETIGWMALAFVLAYLSWRFVEQPVRFAVRLRPITLFAATAVSSAILLLGGSALYVRDGLPGRFSPDVRAHIDASGDFLQDWSRCYVPGTGLFQGIEICPIGPDGPPTFVVWGDSHVRAFKEGLALLANERDKSGLLIWRGGCPPLFDIKKQESAATRQQDEDCTTANARIRKAIPQITSLEKLLLIGRWSYYSEGRGTGNDSFNTISLSPVKGTRSDKSDQHAVFDKAVLETVTELSKSIDQIIVLRQVPEIPGYDSRDMARRLAHHRLTADEARRTLFTVSMPDLVVRTAASERVFRKLAADGKIVWLQSWDSFCSDQKCAAVRNGRSLYFDNNHVINTTALNLRHLFDPLMKHSVREIEKSEATQ